ncbi:hypothetical protein B0A50_04916 [Salinomyces thailandicus]|uniref:dolichol kinase n=1 Tax=Salinomyces thailandicus TaxID=706561 RepID=A0A4U0U141_9PEZI|nr:hypothetical protein B0A50_04916 [Salinomyces thailandica]
MSRILNPPESISTSTDPAARPSSAAAAAATAAEAENLRHFNRTPRPYFRDGYQVPQAVYDGGNESGAGRSAVVSEQGRHQPGGAADDGADAGTGAWRERSGQASVAASESGTEADDERTNFVRALPAPSLRPRKGLRTGEVGEDAFLTPSMLDDEGRRLSEGYFRSRGEEDVKKEGEGEQAEVEKLQRRRLAEFARRSSEVALMGVTIACVLSGRGVWQTAAEWQRELFTQGGIIAVLILAYPVKLSIVDTQAAPNKLWQRFRVPASFDPATVLYPTLLPVLVALSVSPAYPAVILPNIILGLAALPQRLFPRSSRLAGINAVHWLISIIPLILSEHTEITFLRSSPKPYLLKSGPPHGLTSEALVSLYPLHHALLTPLHYLTTTSLLPTELHLLSAVLINLLLLASSPQTVILKACLWVGGALLFVFATPVLSWNVTLARVPRWKLRRAGHPVEERRSLVDAATELIGLQRATSAFRTTGDADSDADEDEPPASIKGKIESLPRLATIGNAIPTLASFTEPEPKSAIEPRQDINGLLSQSSNDNKARPRRNTPPPRDMPLLAQTDASGKSRQGRRRVHWFLQLTAEEAERRRWLYAGWVYSVISISILGPVRSYISHKALDGQEPLGWAIGYLFGQLPGMQKAVQSLSISTWIPLPPAGGDWRDLQLGLPLDVNTMRFTVGLANTRLLLFGYWAAVLIVGLLTVITLTAYVEVDTRRKVFHGVMVAMLVPSIFVDPCFCALALAIILAIFLILEVIRAGQVPPLGNAIGRIVAPYVDGRDLRGPVVVSHIFLLIGCAVPLWFTLASIDRGDQLNWVGWELADNRREVAMVAGVICVGMGDAAASLIGRRYGRHKWLWVGGKSLEGSGAFAVAVTIGLMAAKVWQVVGGWNDSQHSLADFLGASGRPSCVTAWLIALIKAAFCACGASFMEAVLTGANDNVVVPVALWLLVKGSRL